MKWAEIIWNRSTHETLRNNGINNNTFLFAANTLKKLLNPYVPFLRGSLSSEVNTYVERERGVLHYLSPHSHYIYEGRLMVSPTTGSAYAKSGEKKIYTGAALNYNKSIHPLATSRWDKVAWPIIKNSYTRSVQAFIMRGR